MKRYSANSIPKILLLAAVVPLAAGCGTSEDKTAVVAPPVSEVQEGPVRVKVEVDPASPRLSDRPTMTLSVDYPTGVTIHKTPFGEVIGDFDIVDVNEPLPKIEGDREIVQQVFTLEPQRAGKLEIWPIQVTFTDTRPDGDGRAHTVETKPLTVEVGSVIESESPELAALRPEAGPLGLPFSHIALLLWALGISSAGVAGWFVWRHYHRRQVQAAQRPLTPAEIALRELDQLLAEGLAQRDVKLFYVELTGIVRRFIERTTHIRAPEQTTEEFFKEISTRKTFPAEENRRLKRFLEAADLVKFAAHHPREEDIDASLARAKEFVGYTEQHTADPNHPDAHRDPREKETVAC
ncbi:MAG: hypothetical protein JW818_12370 [Pirellulales bacterium]|nr:hypothetical protein [Pirellulales bacterium]